MDFDKQFKKAVGNTSEEIIQKDKDTKLRKRISKLCIKGGLFLFNIIKILSVVLIVFLDYIKEIAFKFIENLLFLWITWVIFVIISYAAGASHIGYATIITVVIYIIAFTIEYIYQTCKESL